MFNSGDLYWHDGLFIQPHHFQKFQRSIEEQFQSEHRSTRAYNYGLIDYELNMLRFKEGYLEFNELSAYMPSGTYIDINTNAIIKSISLKNYEAPIDDSFLVYLGIPLWSNKQPNTSTEDSRWQGDRLYKISEELWHDEDNCDNPTPLLIRKIKCRIFFGNENTEGYELIPVLRFKKREVSDTKYLDSFIIGNDFIPPFYFISKAPELQRIFNEIIYSIRSSAKELDKEIKNSEFFNDAPERLVKAFLRLSSLNSKGIYLSKLISLQNITPFEIYLRLAELIGDLVIIAPDFDLFSQLPDYDHDNIYDCLIKVKCIIEKLLSHPVYIQLYNKESLAYIEKNLYEMDMSASSSIDINDYYIGIYINRPSNEIISIVESGDSFKVLPPSLSRGKAIPGIKLEHQHVLPNGFPKSPGLYYFRFTASEREDFIWEKIINEKKINVSLTDQLLSLIKSVDIYIQKRAR